MFQAPIALGSTTGIVAPTAAPTSPTDGYDLRDQQFAQLWIGVTGGVPPSSADVGVWLLGPLGWLPVQGSGLVTVQGSEGGALLQVEPRGAARCYVQVLAIVGGATVDIAAQGVTY